MQLLLLLLFPIHFFAQTDCKTANVTYSLQLFSTKNIQLFDGTHIDQNDTIVVEEACIKDQKVFRIMIPQENQMFAEQSKDRYSKFYKGCFIVKYIDGKRYN
jgi:hypothetical protein